MSEQIPQQQYDAATAVINQYAGQDVNQLSSDDKAKLATNIAIVIRSQDTTTQFGNPNYVLQNLNVLTSNGKVPSSGDLGSIFSRVELTPPSSLSNGQINNVILKEVGNAWFTPSAMGQYRINVQDLARALKDVHVVSSFGDLAAMKMYITSQMDAAKDIKDSAKKEAEMAKWAMIGAIVGIGVGIGGAAFGGFMKGGSFANRAGGFASALDTSTKLGDQSGKILENAMKTGLIIDKGAIDSNKLLADAAASMAQKAMQSNKDMADAASSQLDQVFQTMKDSYSQIVHNLTFATHG